MPIRLCCPEEGIDRVFDEEQITVGRAPGNTIRLSSGQVSGVHGQVLRRGGGWVFQDLGSTNGSMVKHGDREHVLDGRQSTEAQLFDGALLIVGDMRAPVVLQVSIVDDVPVEEHPPPVAGETIVASRPLGKLSELSAVLFRDPNASQQRLASLMSFMERLQHRLEPASIADRLLDFVFETMPTASLAGVFAELGSTIVPLLLRTRASKEPLPIPWKRVEPLLTEAVERRACVQVEDPKAVASRFEQAAPHLRAVIACPLVDRDKVLGLLVVAGPEPFREADLDWTTLLASHSGLTLRNARLLAELERLKGQLEDENAFLKESLDKTTNGGPVDIIGESSALKRVLRQVEIVARTDTSVLVLGETGTGKELVARMLHDRSPRAGRLFAAVNCGALTETLLESELFGHVKGAFTGATQDKKGLFEVADGGTLFLDEFGDVSPRLQVKLLRVLENGEVTPVGSVRTKHVDVRIVSATNKDLKGEVEAGRFREDLYYRINVFPVRLPPLREREGDVGMLARFFLARFARRFTKNIPGFSQAATQRLEQYAWPGNVRELQNEIERAVLLAENNREIEPEDLSDRIGGMVELPVSIGPLHDTLSKLEGQYIRRALIQHEYNRTKTAKTLGISRQALTAKLHKYDLIDLK